MKVCSKCKCEKDLTEFESRNDSTDRLRGVCRDCRKQQKIQWYQTNKNDIGNIAKYKTIKTRSEINREYRSTHKIQIQQLKHTWYLNNKDHHEQYKKQYEAERYSVDFIYKLKGQIIRLIKRSIQKCGYSKTSKTHEYLGCSYEDFVIHLGPKPEGNIHLDHICPCAQAQNEDELIRLQYYINFRWLSAKDNLEKSDSKTPEAEEMCHKLLGREWID